MSSKRIADLPVKTPIDAMKIPTGGFGDYAITLKILSDWLVNKYSLATKEELANLQVLLLEKIDEEFKKLDVYTKGETDTLIRNVKESLESEIAKLSTRVSENKTRLDSLGTTSKYSVETLPTSKPTEDFVKKSISDLNLGTASKKDVEFFAEQQKQANRVILGNGRDAQSKFQESLSTMDFGARLANVRLSSEYQTLDDARKDFPTAKSLSDTFDIVACEKALKYTNFLILSEGVHYFNRELQIGSNVIIKGHGRKLSKVFLTDDCYKWECGVTTIGNTRDLVSERVNFIVLQDFSIDGNRLKRFENFNNGTVTSTVDGKVWDGDSPSGSNISIVNTRYAIINRVYSACASTHNFDVSASMYYKTDSDHQTDFFNTASLGVILNDCIGSDAGDDSFTTHYSHTITFNNCIALNGCAGDWSNGFEVDDGSRNVVINGGFSYLCNKGLQIKAHPKVPCASNVTVNNFTAYDCTYSYSLENAEFITLDNDSPTAYGVVLNNCTSVKPRKLKSNNWTPRHVEISAYSGVDIDNFNVVGSNAFSVPINFSDFGIEDDSSYKPEYAEHVFSGDVDITYTSMWESIKIYRNARNIKINGIKYIKEKAKVCHLFVDIDAYNVNIQGVNFEHCELIDSESWSLIAIKNGAFGVTVRDVTAKTLTQTDKPILRMYKYPNGTNQNEFSGISGVGYNKPIQIESKFFDYTLNALGKTLLINSESTVAPSISFTRSASASANFMEFSYNGGVLRGFVPATNQYTHVASNGGSYRFGVTPATNLSDVGTALWTIQPSGHMFPPTTDTHRIGGGASSLTSVFTRKVNYTDVVFDSYGTGSPEGVVSASVGSTYRRTDGGVNTTFYVKETGTGNTGWVAK